MRFKLGGLMPGDQNCGEAYVILHDRLETKAAISELDLRKPQRMSAGRTRAQLKGAPDYDDPSFWDTKFATGQDVGEWLNPGEILLDAVISFLERSATATQNRPRVLHLGPGISRLGTKVRDAFSERGWMGNGIVVWPEFAIRSARTLD
jgi:hypothetical protein